MRTSEGKKLKKNGLFCLLATPNHQAGPDWTEKRGIFVARPTSLPVQ